MCCCCHDPDYSRLCRLINNDSLLLSYTESQPISLTKESEKNLLILLSQVAREIRSLENIQDCTSQQEIVGDSASGGKCSHGLNSCSEDNHNCLDNIVTVLVTLFTVESQYVQHSTGNALLLISNFLAKSGKKWVGFLHLLCLCLEVALSNVISSQSLSLKAGNVDSNSDTLSFILAVRKGLAHANWRTTSCLIQVLRNILKQDYDSDLMERYIHSVSNCLSNIPWDMLSDIHADQTSETHTSSITNILHHGKFGSAESRFLFLGALLQLFCSLTEQIISIETGGDSLDKHPSLDIIIGLVPKLLSWCFHKQGGYNHAFASQYLRHKMLVLMTRLNFQSRQECSTLVLWLQLLRRYFQDLINQPFSGHPAGLDDSLEESPFQADVVYGEKICTPHLQRQAIFLFLKCSFSLINLGKEADARCSCATRNSCFTYELQYDQECCNKKRGLSELSEWLQRHVPLETFVDSAIYLGKCRTFASSFLQLYMDEDDFLFEVLLQLTVPFPAKQVEHKEKEKTFEEAQGDVLFHLSNIFNPVHLFHLFLAELHYDHLVLLDYLISKDTGIHCVQYLLRCLRTVSSSWCMFVEYSLHEVESSQLAYKKWKFPEDGPDSNGKIEPSLAVVKEDVNIGLHDRESMKNPKAGGLLNNTKHKTFENAKECLFSLKRSVENLHQKNLFPYTPSALLRSMFHEIYGALPSARESVKCEGWKEDVGTYAPSILNLAAFPISSSKLARYRVEAMADVDTAFIQEKEHRPKLNIIEAGGIPVIDMSPLSYPESTQHLSDLIFKVGSACRDWGFFQAINHGVPSGLQLKIEQAAKKFFSLSSEEKRKVGRDEANPLGYYDTEHTKNVRDWKEIFDFMVDDPTLLPASHLPDDQNLQELTNQWPDYPPELRGACEEYSRSVEKLAFEVLELVALSLGLPKKRLNCYFKGQSSFIRLNHYPPCPSPELALGVGRHKDGGALTVLAQDDVGGLEVKRKSDGEWIRVKPIPDSYIINVGDIIQVWSNDKYESAEHRVVVNSERERFSIPFFFNPAHDVMVKPLEELVNEETPGKYEEYSWGKFLKTRKLSDFKKLDVENIQIYHFQKI